MNLQPSGSLIRSDWERGLQRTAKQMVWLHRRLEALSAPGSLNKAFMGLFLDFWLESCTYLKVMEGVLRARSTRVGHITACTSLDDSKSQCAQVHWATLCTARAHSVMQLVAPTKLSACALV